MNKLTIDQLSVHYAHSLALEGVDVTFAGGTVTGVIGPNGGGKSTLIKAIAGEIDDYHGRILLDGQLLDRRRTPIAYVPQARDVNWDFPLSAADLVMMGRSRNLGWFGRPSSDDRRAVEHALAELGLEGVGKRHISQFSGGQQQRLFLARAVVQQPEIVLLDEPMTGLDLTTRDRIHRLIREFVANEAAVVLVTHDLEEVRTICDQLLCLNRKVIAWGRVGDTFTAENLRAAFGGRIAVFDTP